MDERIGLFLLGTTTSFAIWSALNSSLFTVGEFVKSEEDAEQCRKAMAWGVAICSLFGISIWLVFRDLITAVATILCAVGLWLLFERELEMHGF